MYTLLFVDDEQIIREGMRHCLDWKQLGIEWLGAAKNGKEALEMIARLSPDIVMTDIVMPALTGLQLIEKASALDKPPLFIVYSGYSEFEYAHQAMYYGVRHYLLKPFDDESIVKTIVECVNELDAARAAMTVTQPSLAAEPSMVSKIKKYVIDNISTPNITLQHIADNVLHINHKYASRLFSEKTGMKFKQYVLEQRIELAKEFLMRMDEGRIYEVAAMVGLGHNPQYFSCLFKSATGFSPSEYREHMRAQAKTN